MAAFFAYLILSPFMDELVSMIRYMWGETTLISGSEAENVMNNSFNTSMHYASKGTDINII